MEATFNVNNYVLVKIKDKGYQRLADQHNRLLKLIPELEKRTSLHYKSRADKDGYTRFQMWDFMHKFGDVMFNGSRGYCETEIIFDMEDLTIMEVK